jgi:hypothetical protein
MAKMRFAAAQLIAYVGVTRFDGTQAEVDQFIVLVRRLIG